MKCFANHKFFEEQRAKLPLYLYTQLFKNLNTTTVNAYESVFDYGIINGNVGDMGSIFYIILKGEVSVLLPNPKHEPPPVKENVSDFNEYLQVTYPGFVKVRTLTSGDTFGELALITKSKRTATIVCSIDSYFITLHKNAFDRILYEHHNSIHK
jgi:CRP-like cAMP-binding protein